MKAVISLYQAYPPESGAASVTFNIARNLSGTRRLIQIGDRNERTVIDKDFEIVTLAASSATTGRKLAAMPRLIPRVADEVESAAAETIILEGASWAVYLWLLARSLRARNRRTRLVYHAHNVEYDLRRGRNGRLVAYVTRGAEQSLIRRSDQSFAVSRVDAGRFEALYGFRPRLLPNGVDARLFGANHCAVVGHDVLFMGLPAYPPNAEAIRFLVDRVFPLVIAAEPRARLVVTGERVSFERPWLSTPGLIPFAYLPEFVRSHRLGVAPIFSGSGTRLKILEYMAAGLPVIATAKGAEGLDLVDGQNYLCREDAEGFSEAIRTVFLDNSVASRIAASGQSLVAKKYDWKPLVREFERSLGADTSSQFGNDPAASLGSV